MVGIVIVSHSKQLAQGVRELATQMEGKVSLAIAAGIDDLENPLGTDAMQVHEAIASVYSDEGVIVLMDLGSAVMSAEMALEFLPEEQRNKVYLCEAPLVEGAIAASVAAAANSNIEQVIAEARGALAAKTTQLSSAGILPAPSTSISPAPSEASSNKQTANENQQTKEIFLTIHNRLGLHARPAAKFVATATRFQSQIRVRNSTKNSEFVSASSINQVLTLGVRQGQELALAAHGSDAQEAIAALQALVEANFGEDDTALETQPAAQIKVAPDDSSELLGISAAGGIAIAPVTLCRPNVLKVSEDLIDDFQSEWQRFQVAIETAQQEIQTLRTQTATQIGENEAAIFDAHLLFLADPKLTETVHKQIFEQCLNAETAWSNAIEELANTYRSLEDSYLQERAIDVVDVGQRVLRQLAGASISLELTQPSIIIATDLTPSETAQLDPTKVLGICTTKGSATSHTAILARMLGIPAVVGVKPEILNLKDGTLIAIDGESGRVWVQPNQDTINALEAKRDVGIANQQQALAKTHNPAITRDGKRINVVANIGGVADAQVALDMGAEGVGLLRTEFLFLDRTEAPSEEEQLAVYRAIAQVMGTRPLIVRTLDVGGDKPLPYLGVQQEANSFLGRRGIRFCLDELDIFKTQLRAILRASPGHQMKVLFPMIATVEEVQSAIAILAQVHNELSQAGISFDAAMEVGIMIEVPSAVVIAEHLATFVDFFSIGSNDLSQYVMACDRTNPQVARLADSMHPAVLRMIQQTIQAAHQAGIWVGLCGELAANPLSSSILVGLGLDELSLNPQAIPMLKQAIAQVTVAEAEAIALTALSQDSASKVKALVSNLDRLLI